jgi:hypothetical protein
MWQSRETARLAGALAAAWLACACAATAPSYRVHRSLLDGARTTPAKVVVLPASVDVMEISTSGMESVPEWSRRASARLGEVLSAELAAGGFEVVPLPALGAEEQAVVDEHVYMFRAASDGSLPNPGDVVDGPDVEAWWHKVEGFDLSLGPGLASLAERTGSSAAVVVAGASVQSTGGRKLATFLGSLLTGTYAPTSATDVFLGFVDLRTGDILWVGEHQDEGDWFVDADELTERGDLEEIVRGFLASYPGIEAYREELEDR